MSLRVLVVDDAVLFRKAIADTRAGIPECSGNILRGSGPGTPRAAVGRAATGPVPAIARGPIAPPRALTSVPGAGPAPAGLAAAASA